MIQHMVAEQWVNYDGSSIVLTVNVMILPVPWRSTGCQAVLQYRYGLFSIAKIDHDQPYVCRYWYYLGPGTKYLVKQVAVILFK